MTQDQKDKWLPRIIEVITFLIVIIGLFVANEHRMTSFEAIQKMEMDTIKDTLAAVKVLQENQATLQTNQVRVSTLLEGIEARHRAEDRQRARSN